jgi:hypothetical protein
MQVLCHDVVDFQAVYVHMTNGSSNTDDQAMMTLAKATTPG